MYYSKKITPLELNYNIYNKELLAIVIVLKEQRVFLQGTTELFTKIIKKNKTQSQNEEYKKLFKEIKKKFTEEPILKIYQLRLLIRVETDILDFMLRVYMV